MRRRGVVGYLVATRAMTFNERSIGHMSNVPFDNLKFVARLQKLQPSSMGELLAHVSGGLFIDTLGDASISNNMINPDNLAADPIMMMIKYRAELLDTMGCSYKHFVACLQMLAPDVYEVGCMTLLPASVSENQRSTSQQRDVRPHGEQQWETQPMETIHEPIASFVARLPNAVTDVCMILTAAYTSHRRRRNTPLPH